jgi:lactate dehydrogenase-like 2-hydroxyacid dehydrogenase
MTVVPIVPMIIVTRKIPTAVEQEIAARFNARLNSDDIPMTVEALKEAMRTADVVLCCVADKITADVIGTPGRKVKLLANYGVGFNNIDIAAAKAAGVLVSNTPEVLTEATADLAMTLLLMTARRAGEGERHVRGGHWTGWRPTHMMGTMVSGKTLGLVGFGRIARAVTKKAHDGFGMNVIFHDPLVPNGSLGAEPRATLDAVLGEADFVSLHCPALPETRHLMNAQRLSQMKPSGILINTARGDVVDEAALVAALQKRQIAAAGLDVYEREPTVAPELLKMENVVLLPHLGSATLETREAMGRRALENITLFASGAPLRDRVV